MWLEVHFLSNYTHLRLSFCNPPNMFSLVSDSVFDFIIIRMRYLMNSSHFDMYSLPAENDAIVLINRARYSHTMSPVPSNIFFKKFWKANLNILKPIPGDADLIILYSSVQTNRPRNWNFVVKRSAAFTENSLYWNTYGG